MKSTFRLTVSAQWRTNCSALAVAGCQMSHTDRRQRPTLRSTTRHGGRASRCIAAECNTGSAARTRQIGSRPYCAPRPASRRIAVCGCISLGICGGFCLVFVRRFVGSKATSHGTNHAIKVGIAYKVVIGEIDIPVESVASTVPGLNSYRAGGIECVVPNVRGVA